MLLIVTVIALGNCTTCHIVGYDPNVISSAVVGTVIARFAGVEEELPLSAGMKTLVMVVPENDVVDCVGVTTPVTVLGELPLSVLMKSLH